MVSSVTFSSFFVLVLILIFISLFFSLFFLIYLLFLESFLCLLKCIREVDSRISVHSPRHLDVTVNLMQKTPEVTAS